LSIGERAGFGNHHQRANGAGVWQRPGLAAESLTRATLPNLLGEPRTSQSAATAAPLQLLQQRQHVMLPLRRRLRRTALLANNKFLVCVINERT